MRVPFNFDWPLNEIWEGYLNPYCGKECHFCGGSGYSGYMRHLKDQWYGLHKTRWINLPGGRRYNDASLQYHLTEQDIAVLLKADRLWDFTRRPINDEQCEVVRKKVEDGENSWLPYNNGYVPTPEEVNEWAKVGFGHDSLNAHYVLKARVERAGEQVECILCQGEGRIYDSPEQQKSFDEWEAEEPPVGEGYQLWETTTEGSPVSPVFDDFEKLCVWCEINATTFASYTATKEEWAKMLNEDFVYHKDGRGNVFF